MNQLLIKENEDGSIQVKIEGDREKLVDILAAAIINDPNFGVLILTTLAFISERQQREFKQSNLN